MPTEQQILTLLKSSVQAGTAPWPDLGEALQLGRVRPVPRDAVSIGAATRGGERPEVAVLIRSDLPDGTMTISEMDVDTVIALGERLRAMYRA